MNTKSKSGKGKTAIKYLTLIFVLAVSITFSVLTYGWQETGKKYLTVAICAVCGYVLFFIIYYIAYLITLIAYSKKRKKYVKDQITCNEDIEKLAQNPKYEFKYRAKLSLQENFKNLFEVLKIAVHDVSKGFDKGGRYFYLNYTVYDALSVIKTTIEVANEKFSKPLKLFKLEDKPIGFVEKKLLEIIENEQPKKSNAFVQGVLKAGTFVFSGLINSACNDFISYVIGEAYGVYGKDKHSFDFSKIEVENERDN
ncbi:MAG: hypothetical protein IKL82_05620 [Clostridia bacterium]|nr:hypothetical protein [Clostridia bacterium]